MVPKATAVTYDIVPTACRIVHSEADRLPFYHRQVALMLLPGAPPGRPAIRLLLDNEPQKPGEGEMETALYLLTCVIPAYPRAFDLVLADALYAKAPFSNFLQARVKYALVVLKQKKRKLYQDVAGSFDHVVPQPGRHRSRQCSWWVRHPTQLPQNRVTMANWLHKMPKNDEQSSTIEVR